MAVVYWKPWFSGKARSSPVVELHMRFHGRRRDNFHRSRLDFASLSFEGEKFVLTSTDAALRRCRRDNVNTEKKREAKLRAQTVPRAVGSRLSFSAFVHKEVTAIFASWKRKVFKRELVNTEAELNFPEVHEHESDIFPCEAKFGDGDKTVDGSTYNIWETKSVAGTFGRRAAMLLAGSAVFSTVNCSCCSKALAKDSSVEWDYGGPSGVAKWQGLCAAGPKQSPIDIPLSKVESGESLGELHFDYGPSYPTIVNPGHGTMQVSFAKGKNILRVGGRTLELLQFHFHAPSEHAFDGERYAMEAHLVHRNVKTKKLAVVGIMLNGNKFALPNKVLAESLAYAPPEHGQSVESIYITSVH